MADGKRSRSGRGLHLDRTRLHNEILHRLPQKKREAILSKAEYVVLKLHDSMHEAGERIKFGYFVKRWHGLDSHRLGRR